MSIQYLTYDDEKLPSGNRIVVLNGSDPPRFDPLSQFITEDNLDVVQEVVLDNQARINNLEDTEIKKIIGFLDKVSIKKPFTNETLVEINHFRKEVVNVKVMQLVEQGPNRVQHINITAGTRILEEALLDAQGAVIGRKVILDFGDTPVTGYAIIL